MNEYTNKITEALVAEGYDATTQSVEKANGIKKNAVCVKMPGETVGVTIYTDDMEDCGMSVEDAVDNAKKIYENCKNPEIPEIESIMHYDYAKANVVLRMYGKSTNAEIYRSAAQYGFDDIILVPYVKLSVGDNSGAVKANRKLLEMWGVDEDTLFADAYANTIEDINIKPLADYFGGPFEYMSEALKDFVVVSNNSWVHGASAILGMLDKLKAKHKNGFYVIPASVHEVIVLPKENSIDSDVDSLTELVKEVNKSVVADEEVLSGKAYEFAC